MRGAFGGADAEAGGENAGVELAAVESFSWPASTALDHIDSQRHATFLRAVRRWSLQLH